MKLRNLSKSKYEFSYDKTIEKEGVTKVVFHTFSVGPGEEFEVLPEHPDSMKKLASHYPKDWVSVAEPSKAELQEKLAKLESDEKAEAEKKAKEPKKAKAEKEEKKAE